MPVHISKIKNMSLSKDDDDSTSLRVNLDIPGNTLKPTEKVRGDDLVYVKELSYKTFKGDDLTDAHRRIKDLQKRYRDQLKEDKELENFEEQDELKMMKPSQPPIKLVDVYMRPTIGKKRVHGTLEAHDNGFLFRTRKVNLSARLSRTHGPSSAFFCA